MPEPVRIVLDTDIGTDVDDALALVFALASPEIDLIGVTVVDGDVDQRARIAARLLGMVGRPDIPVLRGEAIAIGQGKGATRLGHEGRGILDTPYDGPEADILDLPAAQWLVTTSQQQDVHIVAIGPLSNVGAAIRLDPAFASRVSRLTIMGAVYDEGAFTEAWQDAFRAARRRPAALDHNAAVDLTAALESVTSGLPVTWVTGEMTVRAHLHQHSIDRLRATNTDAGEALARMADVWNETWFRPTLPERGRNLVDDATVAMLHDPLAVSSLFSGSWLTLKETRLDYWIEDRIFRMQDAATNEGHPARVSVGVDPVMFEQIFIERVEALLRTVPR